MAKYNKWIAGGLGWAFGGPIGAIFGFALGSFIDNFKDNTVKTYTPPRRTQTNAGDFATSLLVLSASVMKADGRVMKSELDYVKNFFIQQFGVEQTKELLVMLKSILEKDIPLRDVCMQIRLNMNHPLRLQLIHYLFGISNADDQVHQKEIDVIKTIAYYLGIGSNDLNSIKAMFYKDTNSSYKILEIDKNSTIEEIKRAYRKMAIKYHPDKVTHLGEEFQKAAKEKFQKVQEAYEQIKKEKGF